MKRLLIGLSLAFAAAPAAAQAPAAAPDYSQPSAWLCLPESIPTPVAALANCAGATAGSSPCDAFCADALSASNAPTVAVIIKTATRIEQTPVVTGRD